MTALAEALDAAQAKALAALEKAYVRGTLDAEAFTERMNEIGCTDAIDQALLVAALDTLKEHGATEPTYSERRNTEKPTDAQRSYIERLAREHEIESPDLAGVTRAQASEIIDSLQRGTYDRRNGHSVLMCACEPSYVCASCRDSSRFDDVYADFREPDPVFVGGEATDDD